MPACGQLLRHLTTGFGQAYGVRWTPPACPHPPTHNGGCVSPESDHYQPKEGDRAPAPLARAGTDEHRKAPNRWAIPEHRSGPYRLDAPMVCQGRKWIRIMRAAPRQAGRRAERLRRSLHSCLPSPASARTGDARGSDARRGTARRSLDIRTLCGPRAAAGAGVALRRTTGSRLACGW